MDNKTFIKGKDSDLESSIETMSAKLKTLGVDIDKASTLNPVPHVYSQHIRDNSCSLMFTNGKGATDKACLASALGEYFERLSCNYFFADYYLGEKFANAEFVHYPNEKWFEFDEESLSMPEGLLDEALWDFYDEESELEPIGLCDTNSGAVERGICALPFVRVRDEKTLYFPVNIIGNLYVSNGMSAGNTKNEARVQALSEIYERYAKNKIIAERLTLPIIPKEVIERYPHIQESIAKLEAHGYHLRVCDASLGGVYPVISVTLINPKDGSVFASFGAHPSFEVALERTVTELLQGRGLDNLDDFFTPSFNADEVSDSGNLEAHFINSTGLLSYDFFKEGADYQFVDWNFDDTSAKEFEYLCSIAHENGHDIYIMDYEHLGVYACRILVVGMSEIYPVEDLLWSNNNDGIYYRESILLLKEIENSELEELIESLEENEYSDMLKVAEFIGVAADDNTAWKSLQMGELKAMIYLALNEHEKAQEWVSWCIHMGVYDEERTRLYRCLHAMLEIEIDDKYFDEYKMSLELMYSEKIVSTCKDIIASKERFYGLHSPGLSLEGFVKHQSLLQGYEKLHQAKTQHAT